MTKKLETLLGLAPIESYNISSDQTVPKDTTEFIEEHKVLINEVDEIIGKIDLALPTVNDLDTADAELDELSKSAKEKFDDLISLGMNVEPRFSGVILQTAGMLLGHAITAKTAKIDKKLRMVQLQLQKAKLDHQIKKDVGKEDDDLIEGEGIVLDRNDLLKSILARQSK